MIDKIKEALLLKKINDEEKEIKLTIIVFGVLILLLFAGVLYLFAFIRHKGIMNNYRVQEVRPLQVTQAPPSPTLTPLPSAVIIRPQ